MIGQSLEGEQWRNGVHRRLSWHRLGLRSHTVALGIGSAAFRNPRKVPEQIYSKLNIINPVAWIR